MRLPLKPPKPMPAGRKRQILRTMPAVPADAAAEEAAPLQQPPLQKNNNPKRRCSPGASPFLCRQEPFRLQKVFPPVPGSRMILQKNDGNVSSAFSPSPVRIIHKGQKSFFTILSSINCISDQILRENRICYCEEIRNGL